MQDMLQLGTIELSNSDWQSLIVLVPKLDGFVRFCIDFGGLNSVAFFDASPMPKTDVLLSQLGETHYMSTLSLTKGYWQVPLCPQDKKKNAFAISMGMF